MIIRKKGDKWLRIDLKADTVEEFNSKEEAELGAAFAEPEVVFFEEVEEDEFTD